jgi:protein-S-isoprenylcysteine O-methyltransferase Ste14
MYLGHLIFLTGVAITLHSRAAVLLTAGVAVWFDRRVRRDEAQLQARFVPDYAVYCRRVRRWLPGLF